jgi:hypothetical protein
MTKHRVMTLMEYAVVLARGGTANYSASAYAVAYAVSTLDRLGTEAHTWAERMCNYGEPFEGADDRKRQSIRTRADTLMRTLGFNATIEVEGDPRGSCLKVSAPGISTLRF